MFLQLSIGLCDARHGREASFAAVVAKRVPDTAGLVSIALTGRHQAINDLTRMCGSLPSQQLLKMYDLGLFRYFQREVIEWDLVFARAR